MENIVLGAQPLVWCLIPGRSTRTVPLWTPGGEGGMSGGVVSQLWNMLPFEAPYLGSALKLCSRVFVGRGD